MSHSIAEAAPFQRFLSPTLILVLIALGFAPMARAQSAKKQVEGVTNFGQVTERYFRGGQVTPEGVDNLAGMGVRTIIDLRDKPSEGEPEACERNGVKYHKFALDGGGTPDDKTINEILSIIQNAKAPIYVHCSAGKHRAGTIAALYRIRVQGWSKEQAWAEQQSYGFGPAEEHPALYAYVYGGTANKDAVNMAQNRESEASKSGKQGAGEKSGSSNCLSSSTGYIPMADAIKRVRSEGASGEALKVDLEWDDERSTVTWDVTFSSGTEYEVDAISGKFLGSKSKSASKLAVLTPLDLNGAGLLTFQEIIRAAEAEHKRNVKEMELKRIKGRQETLFEVLLVDGSTRYYDAATGKALTKL